MVRDSSSPPSFRRDINGLRAWAVVAVMFYHFGVPGFGGGFVGVDVFFVISGFLMTGIVVSGLERGGGGGFSVLAFYLARARRILPALIVLCAALMTLGWWVLLPLDFKMLGTHVVFSLAFLSNIKFWREAGYFDAASHEKWLLHTWSLAVEWQFYLLLPLALLAVWKLRPGRKSILVVVIVGLFASLALSVVGTPSKPTAAFYLLPTRAWEMLVGGVVFLLPPRRVFPAHQRAALEAVGLLLVMGAIIGFDTASAWPGWRALVPVLGTVGVLLAACPASPWTGHTVAQWLGTRSYSIYLWHWPVVVLLTYWGWQFNPIAIAAGMVLTLVLGHLSYQWVETPARRQLVRHGLKWGAVTLVGALLSLATPGAVIQFKDGLPGRLPTSIEQIAKESSNKKPRQSECFTQGGTQSPSCMYGGDRLRAILIGDSHADALTTALAASVPSATDGIMDWTYVSCLTARGVKNLSPLFRPQEKCGEFLEWAFEKLGDVPKDIPLVIVNRTTVYALGHNEPEFNDTNVPLVYFTDRHKIASPAFLSEFAQRVTDTACQLAKNRQVFMVRPIPEMGVDVPKVMARTAFWGRPKDISISLADYHQRHAIVWAAQDAARDRCGVKILDPLPFLCRDSRCFGSKDGRPLYYDDDHLSEWGNKLLVPMFAEVFEPR